MAQSLHVLWRAAGPGWVVANTLGYGLVWAAWARWSQPIWPPLSGFLGGSVTLALYGATLGVGAGMAQALVLRRRAGRPVVWIIATALGLAVSFVAASWIDLELMRAFPPGANMYLTNGAVVIVFGLLVGAGIGVARWRVLRRQSPIAGRWVLISAFCFLIGYGSAMGIFQITPAIEQTALAALFGGVCGALAGLFEWLWLGRRPDAWASLSVPSPV
jgi:hypothetical protein